MKIPNGLVSILIVLIGIGVIYGLGRWDKGIDEDVARWREEAKVVLELGNAYRAVIAAAEVEKARLRAERDSAEAEEGRLVRLAIVNARQDSIAREEAERTPVADIAIRLRLRPLGPDEFIADSTTVRLLWATRLDYQEAASERNRLSLLVPNLRFQRSKADSLRLIAEGQFMTATTRISTLEKTLRVGLEVTECKILGLFKCPSRGAMFIIGGITGVVAATTVAMTTGGS